MHLCAKVVAHESVYETKLTWIKKGGKTDEWIFNSGFFVHVHDDLERSVEDHYHVVGWTDPAASNLFRHERIISMRVSGMVS